MRITNSILQLRSLSALQDTLEGMERAQRRVSTGVRVERPSDDPVATAPIMRTSSSLRALEQHQRNISTARGRLAGEESVLEQLDGTLVRAKQLAIGQAGDPADAATRGIVAREVGSLLDHVQDLANTTYAGSYLFGGQYSDRPPFPDTGPDPAAPPSGERLVEIGAESVARTNHSAEEIFFDSGAVTALESLKTALEGDDAAGIRNAIGALDASFTSVQELTADVGARDQRLEIAASNSDALEVNLQALRSELRDVDIEDAVSDLVNRETGYQAAMLANARILQSTLMDYL